MDNDEVYIQHFYNPAFEGAVRNFKDNRADIYNSGINSILINELFFLRLRTEHAIRNNGYAAAARDKYLINCSAVDIHWRNEKGEKHTFMQDLWDEFAENPCLDGYGELKNVQSLWHSSMFSTGSAYTRYQIRRKTNRSKVPLKLEPLQSYLHDITYSGQGEINKKIKYGIEFEDTKPKTYFFRQNLFESYWWELQDTFKPVPIPADEILHIFMRKEPGQWFGLPFLSPVLIALYEIEDLTDATIAKQKASQVISYIIEGSSPISRTPVGSPVAVTNEENKPEIIFKAKGTNVHYLSKGEKINMFQGADIGNNLLGLLSAEIRKIAAVIGVPYHQLTGDLSDIDFSSLRSLMVELRIRTEYIHNFTTIPLGLKPLTKKFKEIAFLYYKDIEDAKPFFQLPRFYGVDDLKDAQADKLELTSGFGLLTKALTERHITLEELESDLELRKNLQEKYGTIIDLSGTPKKTDQAKNIEPNTNSSSL